MKKIFLLLLISRPVFAIYPEVCGRYLMVGQYSCEASSCSLKVYPGSKSQMIFELNGTHSTAVKKLTGKNIRAWVDLYNLGPAPMKAAFHLGAAMEYPEELGPKAFKLIKEEKCRL